MASAEARIPTSACLSLKQIHPNRGKPAALGAITPEEVEALLDRDNPIDRVRNLVGDNSGTLTQIDGNNAALKTLCED